MKEKKEQELIIGTGKFSTLDIGSVSRGVWYDLTCFRCEKEERVYVETDEPDKDDKLAKEIRNRGWQILRTKKTRLFAEGEWITSDRRRDWCGCKTVN